MTGLHIDELKDMLFIEGDSLRRLQAAEPKWNSVERKRGLQTIGLVRQRIKAIEAAMKAARAAKEPS